MPVHRPESPDLHPAPILAVLAKHGVDFVLIGGLAAAARGSIIPTYDIDIVPRPAEDNLRRLSDALRELDARIRAEGVEGGVAFAHDAESLAAVRVWNLTTPHGDLDLAFVPDGTQGFADLIGDATTEDFYGTEVVIASLADVIRSKQASSRPKDLRVLPVLREILANRDTGRA